MPPRLDLLGGVRVDLEGVARMRAGKRRRRPVILALLTLANRRSVVVCVVLAGITACEAGNRRDPTVGTSGKHSALAVAPRRFAARLSVPTSYRHCGTIETSEEKLRIECASLPGDETPTLPWLAEAERSDTTAELERAAVTDLEWGDGAGNSIDRSISTLEAVSHVARNPVDVLVNLSAAHLLMAERFHQPRDIVAALDASMRALAIDSANGEAAFNRALCANWLGLTESARDAWRRYLVIDASSPWAAEAREHLATLDMATDSLPVPAATAAAQALASFSASRPADARLLGWEIFLGAWGSAEAHDSSAAATAQLDGADRLGRALEARDGDRTLIEAVRVIRGARTAASRRRLANAHRWYADAQRAYRLADYPRADSLLAGADTQSSASRPLRGWIAAGRSATLTYLGRRDQGEAQAASVVRTCSSLREPALCGRANWTLGTIRLRRGAHDSGTVALRRAEGMFRRIGEDENVSAIDATLSEEAFLSGNQDEGMTYGWRVLRSTRRARTSIWRHNALLTLIRAATSDGKLSSARALSDEDAHVVAAMGRPTYVAESAIGRARALLSLGDSGAARSTARDAGIALTVAPAGVVRTQLEADLRIIRGRLLLSTDSRAAMALADSSIATFAPANNPIKMIPSLLLRGDAQFRLGMHDSAEISLRSAAAAVAVRRASTGRIPERAALMAAAREVSDRLVTLLVAGGRVSDALAVARWGERPLGQELPHVGAALPHPEPDVATLDYSMIGDTLFVWIVRGRSIVLERRAVARDAFRSLVDRVNASLELRLPDSLMRANIVTMHALLVAPAIAHMTSGVHELRIATDDDVDNVPFAALHGGNHERLIERYAISHVSRFGDDTRVSPPGQPRHPLFVSSPSTPVADTRQPLASLPAVNAELRAAAALYDQGSRGDDSGSFMSAIPQADMLHFAGHVVFDDARPEASYLALRPHGVSAGQLASLDLHRLRLAVLSGCDAARAGNNHSAGLRGVSDAFLLAGAGGVVGPTWRVDDRAAAALTMAFHKNYAVGQQPARALRHAQLALLRSHDADLESPAAWAAFRFIR